MAERKEATGNGEIEKIRDYLQDSKKNIDRLKKGKKPRRKLRFVINEHKFTFTVLSLMLMTTPFIPLMLPGERPPFIPPPNYESVELTVGLIDSNFTDQDGYPVYEKTEANTSSELIILSSLTNSMLLQAEYLPKNQEIQSKISLILEILKNGTFRDIENPVVNLTLSEQIIGIYALIQAYYSLKGTSNSFSYNVVYDAYTNLIDNYYDSDEDMFLQQNSNSSYLIDQSLAVWLLTTYHILFQQDSYDYGYYAEYIVDSLLDSLYSNFLNTSYNMIYSEYNITSGEKAVLADSLDLMYLAAGLSRTEKFRYAYYFYYSSYYTHQRVINSFTDEDWLVHEANKTDGIFLLKNQAYLTLISYLMNLNYVGSELVNATTLNYLFENGFYENLTDKIITAESCLYGLLIFASEEWSKIQNVREYVEEPEPTKTSFASMIWSLIITLFLARIVIRRIKKKKNLW